MSFDPVLFLIYVNNLTDELLNAKLFADDLSLFSVVYNLNTLVDETNNDFVKIKK